MEHIENFLKAKPDPSEPKPEKHPGITKEAWKKAEDAYQNMSNFGENMEKHDKTS